MLSGAAGVHSSPPTQDFPLHRPVLLAEVLRLLSVPRGGTVVDCTVGTGGHARALLEAVGAAGRVLGLDRDSESLVRAREGLRDFGDRFVPMHADYRDLSRVLAREGVARVDGLLADFGISSFQIDTPERGFSFAAEGPLDMRMDRTAGPTAADLIAGADEAELTRILREFGEERRARRIARAILRERRVRPIRTTRQLSRIVERAAEGSRAGRIHPATRTFQALRIAVNREQEGLEQFVVEACRLLAPGARAAFIAFHSLEDRAVKQTLASLVPRCVCPPELPRCRCGRKGIVERITRKAVRPDPEEVRANPRSRSARLRVVRRLPDGTAGEEGLLE